MTSKKIILYVENEPQIIYEAEQKLRKSFPNQRIEAHKRVHSAIGAVSNSIDDILVVVTDGSISGSTGWELANGLRDRGYNGPILYSGLTDLPEKYQHLFDDTASKSGSELISKLREYWSKR